jgi:hypothetical protein
VTARRLAWPNSQKLPNSSISVGRESGSGLRAKSNVSSRVSAPLKLRFLVNGTAELRGKKLEQQDALGKKFRK